MNTRTQLRREIEQLRMRIEVLRREARIDELTGLGNRRFANERLAQEAEIERPSSLILIDIDFFKLVNDEHGHEVGDHVLQEVSAALVNAVRSSDDVCRIGGEEFIVICPDTEKDAAVELAERLRVVVCEAGIKSLGRAVTISAGIAQTARHAPHPSITFKRADAALYAAKRGGRNQVRAATN